MNQDKLRILYVEDIATDVEYITRVLQKSDITFDLHAVSSKESYISALRDFLPHVILSDHNLPDINSLEALDILRKTNVPIPFILVTGTVSEEFAAQIILNGADDYILKDRPERLPIAIRNVLEKFRIGKEQQNSERKLAISERRYRAMIEKSADMKTLTSIEGKILYASPSVTQLLGYSPEEFMSRPAVAYTHPDDIESILPERNELISTPGASHFRVHRLLLKNGTYGWFECTVTNLLHDPAVGALVANFRDITERKLAEEKLASASRLYEFISQINQAITHTTDEITLFHRACDTAVDIGKFSLSWIGTPDIINKKNIVIAHNYTAIASDIIALKNLKYDDNGPTAIVMRSGEYYVNNDFENKPAINSSKTFLEQRGYRSLIVLPIMKSGKTIATYNMLSIYANLFDEQEIRLLRAAADDISFALDVFEKEKYRKRLEDKVAHSELRLKNAQAIAHFGHWELDFSKGVAEWSEEVCRIYGLATNDNLHTPEAWLSFIHPEDLDYVNRKFEESQETLSKSAYHHRIIRRDGSVRYIFSQVHFEFNADGIPLGIYGVSHDETETKEAENSLAQSEANLTQIINLIPQCIFTKDFDGKYIFTNKTYAALYGYTPREINNRRMSDVIPASDLAEYYLQEDREVMSSGIAKIIPELAINDYKGEARLLHILKVPFTTASTNEKSVLVVMNDITDQKKAEKERAKIVADIIQRNNDLEQFSYIVSHNLRAPVAHILGLVDIIKTVGITKEEESTTLSFLTSATEKLDDVIKDLNQILDLKHSVNEIKENVIFEDVLSEVKSSIYSLFSDQPVNIFSEFSEVPELYSIKSYLYSIFINLISNSIKYRQPGILPVINICTRKVENNIELRFRDNGLGIDLEKEGNKIFGLYKRFHYHVEGKGMGLYMVKSQVDLLGGKISVVSEVNKGTEFCISFDKQR